MLPYTKTESYTLDGVSFPNERDALHAAIVKATGQNAGVATAIMKAAPLLGDLIARCVVIDPPMPAAKMTEAELDGEGHWKSCRARATGLAKDCSCESNEGKAGDA